MKALLLAMTAALAASLATAQPAPEDPYIWLEALSSPRAMAWVEQHNAATEKALTADPRYRTLYDEALAVAADKARIPQPEFLHGEIYNFWQDADHLRGLWRKTSLADYRTPDPHWTTVLNIDALGKAEGKSWVLKGIDCLHPEDRLCLVRLSEGGEDAAEVREFDLSTGAFVPGGFHLPRAKHEIAWEDADHLLVASEWTPGDLTVSGYPYIVKRVTRGEPLDKAVEVFRGTKADVLVAPTVLRDAHGNRLAVIQRALDFFHNETFALTPSGVSKLAMPQKAHPAELVDGRVIVKLDEAWDAPNDSFPAGSVVDLDLAAVKSTPERLLPSLVFAPGAKETVEAVDSSKSTLLVTGLNNVRGRVWAFRRAGDGWRRETLPLPDKITLGVAATDDRSDLAFIGGSGFLDPSTLRLADTATGALDKVKSLPPQFAASRDVVEQLEATSTDGTKIPYFVVHRRDLPLDGTTPTLMTAYGGFQVSRTPAYSGQIGKLWLERGGAFVLANIRGGGEFGPAWHEAGLKTKRQIVYDDFAAVARDLIARKITSPRRLGIQGGSNGGLLMGVEFTQHPELWDAVVIQVPLLDMIRIGHIAAGASWQGEYGDPETDPAVRAFWLKTSPYQNLKAGVRYPEPFIFTTTKDDRVGPQHARKFAARMEEMGLPFYFYESTEGGHGAGADLKQAAHTTALTTTYLMRKLMD